MTHHLTLALLPGRHAVCRLPADAAVPSWAAGAFLSVTRTADELSVVCRTAVVPEGVKCERGWRCLRVAGSMDFSIPIRLACSDGPTQAASPWSMRATSPRSGEENPIVTI